MTVETRIIKPTSTIQDHIPGSIQIFLAGSIDNGAAVEWQADVENQLMGASTSLTIYNPRRDDWDANLVQDMSNPDFSYQVNWELDHLSQSNIALFYFSPDGPAPITLMELGFVLGQASGFEPTYQKVIVACPEGYWRRGNVQVMCDRAKIQVHDTLDAAIAEILDLSRIFETLRK